MVEKKINWTLERQIAQMSIFHILRSIRLSLKERTQNRQSEAKSQKVTSYFKTSYFKTSCADAFKTSDLIKPLQANFRHLPNPNPYERFRVLL
jgi:hypothetical protein